MNKLEKFIVVGIAAAVIYFLGGMLLRGAELYKPTELQTLRLQLKQKDAQIAQQNMFIAQREMQSALARLNDEAEKVKAENQWPSTLSFNPDNLSFTEAPIKEAPVK